MKWEALGEVTLLIADTDLLNRKLITSLLAKIPTIKIIETENSNETLELLDNEKIDMVLLDYHMQHENQEETLKAIKKEDKYEYIPVVMITTDEREKKNLYANGANDILIKPLKLTHLEAIIYKHIEKKQYRENYKNMYWEIDTKDLHSSDETYTLKAIEDSQKEIFYGMAMLYSKKYNSANSKIIANIAKEYALVLGYDENVANNIYYATMIRDIGSLAITKNVRQDYRFTKKDKEHYNHSMLMGYQVVNNSIETNFITIAKAVISQRKEAYDGSGIPHQLKADKISPFATIVAISETFHALLSPRAYRVKESYTTQETYRILEQESNRKFKASMVSSFLEHFDNFIQLREKSLRQHALNYSLES
ncbi:response regulator [bacterium]|nr:response regulator [bacterium]MBU1958774.1 response regulator [bacterium]